MIIDELVLHNFGVYKGRQSVQLTPPSRKKPVILFGGLNGGGKTTLLDALQLSLFGKFAQCSNRGSLGYSEFLGQCINSAIDPKDGAGLEIEFRHTTEGEENSYRVIRSWSRNGKGVRESLEVLVNGKRDNVLTELWYESVSTFLPPSLASLFFFDGEKVEALADVDNSRTMLGEAIHSLLGIDVVDRLRDDLQTLSRRKRIVNQPKDVQDEIHTVQLELQEWIRRKDESVDRSGELRRELKNKRGQLRRVEATFIKEGGLLYEVRKDLENERSRIQSAIHEKEDALRSIATGVGPLMLVEMQIQGLIEQDRAEEVQKRNTVLLESLEQRDAALLSAMTNFDLDDRQISGVEEYLTSDRSNRMTHEPVECYLNLTAGARQSLLSLPEILRETKTRAQKLLTETSNLENQLQDVNRKLSGVPSEEKIAYYIKQLEKLRREINEKEAELSIEEKQKASADTQIEMKDGQLTRLIERQVDAEQLAQDAGRTISYSGRVGNTLNEFRKVLVGRHVKEIERLVLDSFLQLLRKEALVSGLSIDPSSFELTLFGHDRNVLPANRLSAGERQLLAISLLWGLARASGRPVPTVIDTPLGRLDTLHREKLVSRYFPRASHQVLLLSTDEEIDAELFRELKPRIGRSYHLSPSEGEHATKISSGYFWQEA